MNKLALLTGYTPGSASVTFGKIKQKIKLLGDSLSSAGPAAPKNGNRARHSTSTPKKRSAANMFTTTSSPSAKRFKKGQHEAYANDDDDEDQEDDDEDLSVLRGRDNVKVEAEAKIKREKSEEIVDLEDEGFCMLGAKSVGGGGGGRASYDFLDEIEKFS